MRVISCQVENFASYGNLEYNFSNSGLTLLHGATGSGKSTLCDIIPWVLFGKTAKGGAVDDVLSWPGRETAWGRVAIYLNNKYYSIIRTRKPNDLFFYEHGIENRNVRGKDLVDTQKLINQLLGFDYDLYLSAAYFHEFSQTSQFFTTTAKNRRAITEQLVDLTLPKKLQERTSVKVKELKEALAAATQTYTIQATKVESLVDQHKRDMEREAIWEANRAKRVSELLEKSEKFQSDTANYIMKLKLSAHSLDARSEESYIMEIKQQESELPPERKLYCSSCGEAKVDTVRETILARIADIEEKRRDNFYKLRELKDTQDRIHNLERQENPYENQLATIAEEINPYDLKTLESKLTVATTKLYELQQVEKTLRVEKSDLEILSDIVADFRGILIKNTVLDIEDSTNLYLSNHFDAEIKIALSIEDADKLEVSILKDGNKCVYTQLSKGQRQLLKLCFGVAVMEAVSNHHGINFNQLFFDEALDGLDDNFKAKAFKLLQTLSLKYESIFVVEHSADFKTLFPNKYLVELINGESQINAQA